MQNETLIDTMSPNNSNTLTFPVPLLISVSVNCVLVTIGVMGNSAVIIIISRVLFTTDIRATIYVHIAFLSCIDLIYLLMTPFSISYEILGTWVFNATVCKLMIGAETLNKTLSVYVLVVLSGDRYQAIQAPMSGESRDMTRPIRHLLFLALLIVIGNTPMYYYTGIVSFGAADLCYPDFPVFGNGTTIWDHGQTYYAVYLEIIYFAIPACLIVGFYSRLLFRLRQKESSQAVKSKFIRRSRVTMSILVVIGFYFTCWAPYWILQICFLSGVAVPWPVSQIGFTLPLVNSSFNPILYGVLNQRLRKSYQEAIEKQRGRRARAREASRLHRDASVGMSVTTTMTAMNNGSPQGERKKIVEKSLSMIGKQNSRTALIRSNTTSYGVGYNSCGEQSGVYRHKTISAIDSIDDDDNTMLAVLGISNAVAPLFQTYQNRKAKRSKWRSLKRLFSKEGPVSTLGHSGSQNIRAVNRNLLRESNHSWSVQESLVTESFIATEGSSSIVYNCGLLQTNVRGARLATVPSEDYESSSSTGTNNVFPIVTQSSCNGPKGSKVQIKNELYDRQVYVPTRKFSHQQIVTKISDCSASSRNSFDSGESNKLISGVKQKISTTRRKSTGLHKVAVTTAAAFSRVENQIDSDLNLSEIHVIKQCGNSQLHKRDFKLPSQQTRKSVVFEQGMTSNQKCQQTQSQQQLQQQREEEEGGEQQPHQQKLPLEQHNPVLPKMSNNGKDFCLLEDSCTTSTIVTVPSADATADGDLSTSEPRVSNGLQKCYLGELQRQQQQQKPEIQQQTQQDQKQSKDMWGLGQSLDKPLKYCKKFINPNIRFIDASSVSGSEEDCSASTGDRSKLKRPMATKPQLLNTTVTMESISENVSVTSTKPAVGRNWSRPRSIKKKCPKTLALTRNNNFIKDRDNETYNNDEMSTNPTSEISTPTNSMTSSGTSTATSHSVKSKKGSIFPAAIAADVNKSLNDNKVFVNAKKSVSRCLSAVSTHNQDVGHILNWKPVKQTRSLISKFASSASAQLTDRLPTDGTNSNGNIDNNEFIHNNEASVKFVAENTVQFRAETCELETSTISPQAIFVAAPQPISSPKERNNTIGCADKEINSVQHDFKPITKCRDFKNTKRGLTEPNIGQIPHKSNCQAPLISQKEAAPFTAPPNNIQLQYDEKPFFRENPHDYSDDTRYVQLCNRIDIIALDTDSSCAIKHNGSKPKTAAISSNNDGNFSEFKVLEGNEVRLQYTDEETFL